MGQETSALVFVHVPKAGGITFKAVLFRQYSVRDRFYRPSTQTAQGIRELAELPEKTLRSYGLIYVQHAGFGLHALLPQASRYVTFLREPWSRTVSDFYHACRVRTHSFYARAKAGATLEDFVDYRLHVQGLSNPMTRLISGCNPYPPFHPVPPTALDEARENIDRYFSEVGLVERYDESLLLMRRHHRWKSVFYIQKNTRCAPGTRAPEPPPSPVAAFGDGNELDLQLYGFAKRRLEQAIEMQGDDFAREVSRFQSLNRIFQTAYGMLHDARRTVLRVGHAS